MEILDNKTHGNVGDKLKEDIKTGTKLSIISAYFTIYAYESLRKELNKIDDLRLLFSEPTFVNEKKDIRREFKLNGSFEKGIAGDKYEIKLKGELKQSEILNNRIQTLRDMDEYVGQYYSKIWVWKNVLQMTEDEIEDMIQEIDAEGSNRADQEEQY